MRLTMVRLEVLPTCRVLPPAVRPAGVRPPVFHRTRCCETSGQTGPLAIRCQPFAYAASTDATGSLRSGHGPGTSLDIDGHSLRTGRPLPDPRNACGSRRLHAWKSHLHSPAPAAI